MRPSEAKAAVHAEMRACCRSEPPEPMLVGQTRVYSVRFLVQDQGKRRMQKRVLAERLEPRLRDLRDAIAWRARLDREIALREELFGIWFDGRRSAGEPLETIDDQVAALGDLSHRGMPTEARVPSSCSSPR